MKTIGLLSDTHGYWDEKYTEFFEKCDEIWHAGDIGNIEIIQKLASKGQKIRAVYGNIDGQDIRLHFPLHNRFKIEDISVWITHIGGYPGKYNPIIINDLINNPPKLFICGHSHITKVMYDKKLNLLHMNPGAAGKEGFQQVRRIMRFAIDKDDIKNLEILELK